MPLAVAEFANKRSRFQFNLQLLQVFFVGLTVGMMRTVVPAVADTEFGVPRGSMTLIVTFVVAFGLVKAVMNFVAGTMSERFGRKPVLVVGWLVALPIPFMIRFSDGWGGWWWIVAATVLLGVNQGLTWSMTLTSKLDLSRPDQRGLVNGLNEFSGYLAVAVAGVVTGWLSAAMGPRQGLFVFGSIVISSALVIAAFLVRETRATTDSPHNDPSSGAIEAFRHSWCDRSFFAICQAGLIEKFIDALMWVVLPVFLAQQNVELKNIGWIPAAYATTWGVSQLFTGRWSDRVGRKVPIVVGMMMCGAGAIAIPLMDHQWWWTLWAAIAGLGMGLLYPTLSAAVSDLADDSQLGTALGVYRFWRDLGYAIGGIALGLAIWNGGSLVAAFVTVGSCMMVSGIAVAVLLTELTTTRS